MRSRAIRLLKEEKSEKEAEELLIDYLVEFGLLEMCEKETTKVDARAEKYFAIKTELRLPAFYAVPVKKDSG